MDLLLPLLWQFPLFLGFFATLWMVSFGVVRWLSWRVGGVEEQEMRWGRGALFWSACLTMACFLAIASGFWLLWWGLFRLPVVVVLSGAVWVYVWHRGWPLSLPFRAFGSDISRIWRALEAEPATRWGARLFLMAFALLALRALLLPPLSHDTTSYHASKAAFFVQDGHLFLPYIPGGWSVFRLFSSGASVLQAWVMLPFSSDLFFGVVDLLLALGVLLLASLWLGVLSPQASLRWHLLLWWLLLSIPLFWKSLGAGYTELGLTLALLQAAFFTGLTAMRGGRLWLLLSWCALASAFAIKLPGLAAAGALFLLQLAILLFRAERLPALKMLLVGLFLFFAANLPWLCWNTQETGYPLAPYPLKVAGVTLGKMNPSMQWYATMKLKRPRIWADEWVAHKHLFVEVRDFQNPVLGIGMLPILLLGVWGGLWLLWRRPWWGAALWAILAANLYGFYHPTLSHYRLYGGGTILRFLLQSVVLLSVCFVALCSRWRMARVGRWGHGVFWWGGMLSWIGLLMWGIGSFLCWSSVEYRALALCGAAWLLWWVAVSFLLTRQADTRKNPFRRGFVWGFVGLAGMACLLFFQAQRDGLRLAAYAKSCTFHRSFFHMEDALPFVDDPRKPLRIAVTAGPMRNLQHHTFYSFFGRRLQNRLIFLPQRKDGGYIEQDRLYMTRVLDFDGQSWMDRLRAARIDYVLSLVSISPEYHWMAKRPQSFTFLVGKEGEWGLFGVEEKSR